MEKKESIAIITGASSGMGYEFALQIAQRYRSISELWLIARREEKLQELEKKLLGRKVRLFAMDITDEAAMEQFQITLSRECPRVRILVNAAGYGIMGQVSQISTREQTDMVALNCQTLTRMTCMVLPYLHRGSQIIQMASAAAFVPQPGFSVYAASKAYVLNFSRALGQELKAKGITVTAVCPGAVKTAFFDRAQTYEQIKPYKKLVMAPADKVVYQALVDAKAGRAVSVYGPVMKLFRVLCKVVPAEWIMRFCG